MANINVYFYKTSQGRRRASIIEGTNECLYMSEAEAREWLEGKVYTVGQHTPQVRRRLGRI